MKNKFLLLILIITPFIVNGQNNLVPSTADCSGRSLPFDFNISEAWISNTGNDISSCATPLAGDIDGDGIVEIFALSVSSQDKLYVLDGRDGSTITTLAISGNIAGGVTSNIVLCKINGVGAIFNAGKSGINTLFMVTSAPGVRPITFEKKWEVSNGNGPSSMPIATDFDGDGIIEFVARGQIIDSQDGSILATITFGSSISKPFDAAFPLAMDLDGDGLPEVTAGPDVYKFSRYTIPNLQPWRSLTNLATTTTNGTSMGADINQDGNMDLVFSNNDGTTIYVWTPQTNTLIGTITIPASGAHSYPFVGDIDGVEINGKKYPEICINTTNKLFAYTFDGTNFTEKWNMGHTDSSGSTALTLFDFNNDGIVELVYRDETHIRIFDGRPNGTLLIADALYSRPCGSVTCDETPIIVDVTGDGSADIIVTGAASGNTSHPGEIMVFEGGASKWASCPPVWNQQMYSPLHVNADLSIPDTIKMMNLTFNRSDGPVQFYNGGPMQAPYISEESYWPVDLSPDIYIIDGSITFLSSTSVQITVQFGNDGLAVATSSTPIQYYKNAIATANIIGSETLGVDLRPGQTRTITKTITGLSPMPDQFYVRILDDGVNFPALGAYSDCNLTNNRKSFGTFELLKTVNAQSACVDGTSIFTIKLVNNTNQTNTPKTYTNIQLTDSLGTGWDLQSANPLQGTLGAYNPVTRKQPWTIASLAPGDTATLRLTAKATAAGAIRNTVWIEEIDNTPIGREEIEAYVIVSSSQAPSAANISPATPKLCSGSVTLTASVAGATSYQWYKDDVEITGAIQRTYAATLPGNYKVTYYDGTCVSQMSNAVTVSSDCIKAIPDTIFVIEGLTADIDVLKNDTITGCTPSNVSVTLSNHLTSPYATVQMSGNLLEYTSDRVGLDSLRYILTDCNSSYQDSATVYILVQTLPDNIVDPGQCFVPMDPITFTLREQGRMIGGAHPKSTPLVGDLDGDGIPEIVVLTSTSTSYTSHNRINIFDGSSLTVKGKIALGPAITNDSWMTTAPMVLVDTDNDGKGEIIYAHNNKLYAYKADIINGEFTLTSKWPPGIAYSVPSGGSAANLPQPLVADFNGDGTPEIVVFNQIFNANTGALMGTTEAIGSAYMGRNPGHSVNKGATFLTAADMDGDGYPEIIAGAAIYKVKISSDGTTATCSVLSKNTTIGDGFTAVADLDLDGKLEVVISKLVSASARLYIWRPDIAGGGAGTYKMNMITNGSNTTSNAHSFPFIGDIDGVTDPVTLKKYPEICLMTVNAVTALTYDQATDTHKQLWKVGTSDGSGGTGITLFDFDNDGASELVYRDETLLRIIDGKNGVNKTTFPCASGTAWEYPVIADTDGDGSANICVSCYSRSGKTSYDLVVFESNTEPWTPTRQVWNQINYEPLLINENLTTPKFPIMKNTAFDGKYPYNGALIQVPTMVTSDFSVVMLAADPTVEQMWLEPITQDSIRVWVRIENLGVKNTKAGLPVALYGVSPLPPTAGGSDFITSKPVNVSIIPGSSYAIFFDLPKADYPPTFSVRIQDDGVKYPADGSFLDCDYSNNAGSMSSLFAVDDQLVSFGPTVADLLFNDYFGACERGSSLLFDFVAGSGPSNGTITVNADSTVTYTPTAGYLGMDSVDYYIQCGTDKDTARVYITVTEKPDNIIEADCWITPPATIWDMEKTLVGPQMLNSMMTPVTGDLDGDGIPEIVAFNLSGNGYYSNALYVYYGTDRTNPQIINMKASNNAVQSTHSHDPGAMAIVKADINNDGVYVPLIIVHHTDGYLRAYNPAKPANSELVWESSVPAASATTHYVSVNVADFNNDGHAEVYTSNRIFDAATGKLLVSGAGNSGFNDIWAESHHMTFAADLCGDERLELAAGTQVYDVRINSRSNPALNNMTVVRSIPGVVLNGRTYTDGASFVVDINQDGRLDVVFRGINQSAKRAALIAWDVENEELIASIEFANTINPTYIQVGIPFVGDVDGDGLLELLVLSTNRIFTYKIDEATKTFVNKWAAYTIQDVSGATGITLFDFNQDGISELVYRDETELKILNATASGLIRRDGITPCRSGTIYEYPLVADVDNDGHAEIVTIGIPSASGNLITTRGTLHIIKSKTPGAWASARKVWNQYAYNVLNIHENLTTPTYPLSPTALFPGADGILGTNDDVRPYNNFLQQQSALSKNGMPIWLAPDVYPDPSLITTSVVGNTVTVHVGIINKGDAIIGPPVYVTLYKNLVSDATRMNTGSINMSINPGDTGYVSVTIPDITLDPPVNIAIRVNDDGTQFTYQQECDSTNNVTIIRNPALHLLMKKEATLIMQPSLNTFVHNGTYPNPVSTLYGEEIEYTITAVNTSLSHDEVIIRDTVPAHLYYVPGSATTGSNISVDSSFQVLVGLAAHDILKWTFTSVPPMATRTATFRASPLQGVCASQPKFMNRAWITVDNLFHLPTNYTYHQGACVGIATFSAGYGGQIYNATEQALDYMTKPRSGIVVIADEGHRFAGWSHTDYTSLRGETIEARTGIMLYDTLVVYGTVNLHAEFEPETYPVHYYLNGADNAPSNPASYTIQSGAITLNAPQKAGDEFIGWTGSNGEIPQAYVVIPEGATGELVFYANFLYGGREKEVKTEEPKEDKIWGAESELYVRTSNIGSIVRVYTTDGVLYHQQTIVEAGVTKITQLPRGLYAVTLDNGIGRMVQLE